MAITAKFMGLCPLCDGLIYPGEPVNLADRSWCHARCTEQKKKAGG